MTCCVVVTAICSRSSRTGLRHRAGGAHRPAARFGVAEPGGRRESGALVSVPAAVRQPDRHSMWEAEHAVTGQLDDTLRRQKNNAADGHQQNPKERS